MSMIAARMTTANEVRMTTTRMTTTSRRPIDW
jgi:hypothetical protein